MIGYHVGSFELWYCTYHKGKLRIDVTQIIPAYTISGEYAIYTLLNKKNHYSKKIFIVILSILQKCQFSNGLFKSDFQIQNILELQKIPLTTSIALVTFNQASSILLADQTGQSNRIFKNLKITSN